jgi:hypothetical protein
VKGVVPAPIILTVLPVIVATSGFELLNVISFPEAPPVAVSKKFASPYVAGAIVLKTMA